MSHLLTLRFFKNGKAYGNVDWDEGDNIVLGRQRDADEQRLQIHNIDGQLRIPFAKFPESNYSRSHLTFTQIADAKVRITVTGNSVLPVLVNPDSPLCRNQSVERVLPTEVTVGEYCIRIERSLRTLSRQTKFHTDIESFSSSRLPITVSNDAGQVAMVSRLIEQLSAANSILQQATTRDELYSTAIASVKGLIDMDGVAIINAKNTRDIFCLEPVIPSEPALNEILQSRRVSWKSIDQSADTIESLLILDCFIGAPIVMPAEREDEAVAILYAHRAMEKVDQSHIRREPLSELQAQIFELIACSVAAGLVRIDHQATQGRFQQFFTPALARELMKSDSLLEPSEREVTILFCDIRGFSGISEKLGPSQTAHWIQDVLTSLSDCVLEYDGVLVDYIGDELMAMWGAPTDQPDHAIRACQCAHKMIEILPIINDKWRSVIGHATEFGIGINSGTATVGNTGSKYKFKYGPLGDTVNRASRVQGLTKYLRVNAILTGDTKSHVGNRFQTRRLGKAKVVNIDKSIELFELCPDSSGKKKEFASCYENALEYLEQGNLGTAANLLKALDFDSPDHPALLIMNEIIHRVINDRQSGDFQWEFMK